MSRRRFSGYFFQFIIPCCSLLLPAACAKDDTARLFAAPPKVITIEVIRGERVQDFVERLAGQRLLTGEAFASVSASFTAPQYAWLPPYNPPIVRFEGLFTPGTYRFNAGDFPLLTGANDKARALANAEHLVRLLLEASAARFNRLQPVQGLGAYQQIILASIVEREAILKKDYKEIASTFLNRLAIESGLGSCVTVEYAIGFHRYYLLYDDLKVESPYNTYRRRGLPPGPIAFFTDDALAAVNRPIKTDYLFFVFDWIKGVHYFSALYADHERYTKVSLLNFEAVYPEAKKFEVRPYVDY